MSTLLAFPPVSPQVEHLIVSAGASLQSTSLAERLDFIRVEARDSENVALITRQASTSLHLGAFILAGMLDSWSGVVQPFASVDEESCSSNGDRRLMIAARDPIDASQWDSFYACSSSVNVYAANFSMSLQSNCLPHRVNVLFIDPHGDAEWFFATILRQHFMVKNRIVICRPLEMHLRVLSESLTPKMTIFSAIHTFVAMYKDHWELLVSDHENSGIMVLNRIID